MAVITQNYDIDLKSTGERPVVKMSQFDTGSRTIAFTVYDGHELAHIDGMVARVDGTRSDGVEFSSTCTVGSGSKVSFTISQEMTKHAGKHAAELVIIDASGNPIGTQNFIIEVEAAPMVRDSAASADDRTLYDQYTDSVEQKFSTLSTSLTDTLTEKTDALTKTVQDIDALLGGSSTAQTIINQNVTLTLSGRQNECNVTLTYDPISGLVVLNVSSQSGIVGVPAGSHDVPVLTIPTEYLPSDDKYIGSDKSDVRRYVCAYDGLVTDGTTSDWGVAYCLKENGQLFLRFERVGSTDSNYEIGCSASWQARGGRYLGVTPIPTGSNTVTVGTTTTINGGAQASVTNSGTAKDVVLDFEIPTQSFKGAGEDSVAISVNGDAESPGFGSIAIGRNAHTDAVSSQSSANYSIAIGKDAAVGHRGSVVIGGNAELRAQGSGDAGVIIGVNARGDRSAISIGSSAGNNGISPTQVHGVSIGRNAWAYFERSVALGEGARATASDQYHGCIALGGDAIASAIGSVALGEKSKATDSYTVSVGEGVGSGDLPYHVATRRIVNVSDPRDAQDAATKAYVDSHAASGGYTLPAATADTLGGVKAGGNLTVADDGTLSVPTATGERYGVVKPGAGLAISADNYLIVRPASSSIIGGVKVGSGLTATSDGEVSARTYGSFGDAYTKIAIGLSSSSGLLCLGADSQSFVQKDLDNDGKRYSLGLRPATASTVGGVKIGAGLSATTDGTLSTSVTQSLDLTNSALAIGDGGTKATGGAAMAVGLGATASAGNATAVGQAAAATKASSLAVGSSATAAGAQATAIGVRAIATGGSTALGSDASVSNVTASDAIGCKSSVTATHAVALGASSVADAEWSVSVGNTQNTRRIVNVTDPVNAQDAATKAYVDALIAKLKADNNLN